MALADIIKRIEGDAAEEAARIVAEAESRAETALSEARNKAEVDAGRIAEKGRREADAEAATRIAAARLGARDEALIARRELIDAALARLVAGIEALPGPEYAAFLGDAVAAQVQPGDVIALAGADAGLIDQVRSRVDSVSPGAAVQWSTEPAELERGALIVGSRTRVEVSARSIVAEKRDELEVSLASALFTDGEA